MKIRTSELKAEDGTLDWAVAKCQGVDEYILNESFMTRWTDDDDENDNYHYSSDWAQCGPIIEQEIDKYMRVPTADKNGWVFVAYTYDMHMGAGPTLLIAAMRCYVASKLGPEVEVPDHLFAHLIDQQAPQQVPASEAPPVDRPRG